jgi:hypothetical protein
MTVANQSFAFLRGDDIELAIPVTEDGEAADLTGATVRFSYAREYDDAPLATKTLASGVSIATEDVDGVALPVIRIAIGNAETAGLLGEYAFECEVTIAGIIATVATGRFRVIADMR